jgi:hypothetical protein
VSTPAALPARPSCALQSSPPQNMWGLHDACSAEDRPDRGARLWDALQAKGQRQSGAYGRKFTGMHTSGLWVKPIVHTVNDFLSVAKLNLQLRHGRCSPLDCVFHPLRICIAGMPAILYAMDARQNQPSK